MRVKCVVRVFSINKPFLGIYEACTNRVIKRVTHISAVLILIYERTIKMNSETSKQLDIMDEAIALMNAARTETYNLTLAEALEILKIHRIDILINAFDTYLSNIGDSLSDIAYPSIT